MICRLTSLSTELIARQLANATLLLAGYGMADILITIVRAF
ncbi:hypothetical protein [Altererythrobacter sp. MF3-039]